MNLGGIGKGASAPQMVKPVADVAEKAAKAGQIKSIKLKMKFGKKKPNGD